MNLVRSGPATGGRLRCFTALARSRNRSIMASGSKSAMADNIEGPPMGGAPTEPGGLSRRSRTSRPRGRPIRSRRSGQEARRAARLDRLEGFGRPDRLVLLVAPDAPDGPDAL